MEILTYKKGEGTNYMTRRKKSDYFMFDDVFVRCIERKEPIYPIYVGKGTLRIDPAYKGIHIVDIENGGERIFVAFNKIDSLIKDLDEVEKLKLKVIGNET